MNPAGFMLAAVGLFVFASSLFRGKWFVTKFMKARNVVKVMGLKGARVLYMLFGLAFTVLGLLIAFGVFMGSR